MAVVSVDPDDSRLTGADAAAVPGIARAAAVLRAGGLVGFPTETVYGLGADACDAAAVRRIFAAKGRPPDNPLIVHVAGVPGLEAVAVSVPALAARLARRWWPGPLTLVVDADRGVPRVTTGGLSTVAVRAPAHPVALGLLRAAGMPLAAPSANRSGRPSPTTAAHVLADLGGAVDLVLDAGPCPLGVESTVVDARGDVPVVLREGAVTREQLGVEPSGREVPDGRGGSPGTRYRHYAPACDVTLAPPGQGPALAAALARSGRRIGLVAAAGLDGGTGPDRPGGGPEVQTLARFANAADLARLLYGALRSAEDAGLDVVVVEGVEEVGIGRAVMDRLRRAASP